MRLLEGAKRLVCVRLFCLALALGSGCEMNQSFSSNCEAVTHDSDIRKLTFVFRDAITGVETPIDPTQILEGLPPNPELLPMYFANIDGRVLGPVFTRPYELRNRNKATFNVKFTPPEFEGVVAKPTVTPEEPQAKTVTWKVGDAEEWGDEEADFSFDGTPATLLLPAAPVEPDYIWLKQIIIEITTPFAGPGLADIVAGVKAGTNTIFTLDSHDMESLGLHSTTDGFAIPCNGQQLTWHIESAGCALADLTAGAFIITLEFEKRNPNNFGALVATSFLAANPSILPVPFGLGGIPQTGAIITKVSAVIIQPFYGDEYTQWLINSQINGQSCLAAYDPSAPAGTVYTSGLLNIPFDPTLPNFATATISGSELTDLTEGLIYYFYEWTEPVPFTWTEGDQLAVLAFASLDDIDYTPISMARHDWSNTPFVDIVKFDAFNLPDDFDPGVSLAALYPTIDSIAFKNSIMLFMSDFDNASTWNYLRFLIAWIPAENSGNGNVALSITANAREL